MDALDLVFGLSIAFAASSFFLSFFSFGGGALIWRSTVCMAVSPWNGCLPVSSS